MEGEESNSMSDVPKEEETTNGDMSGSTLEVKGESMNGDTEQTLENTDGLDKDLMGVFNGQDQEGQDQ